MRLPTAMMVMCVMMAAAPASGASRSDHDNCNADDPDRNIAGCTRVLEDKSESAKVRSIAYVGRGLAWDSKGDLDKAMADFTEAIRLDPNNGLAYNDRAILWREKHDIDRAIADFTEAIRIAPFPRSDLPGSGHVNTYTNRGLAYQAKGDFDRALSDFDQATIFDPKDVEAYYHRALMHLWKRDLDHAIGDLGAVIRLDPNNTDAYYRRGTARYDQYMNAGATIAGADLDGAIADFTEVIRLDPKMNDAYRARGLAWNAKGNREHAVANLTEAVRLNPIDSDTIAALRQLKPDYQPPSSGLSGFFGLPAAPSKQ
jgi:tetratricopeptide (TPR) repeat protein